MSNRPSANRIDDWEDDLARRYPHPDAGKSTDAFRDYDNAPAHVREFYRQNHKHQTVEFVRAKRRQYQPGKTCSMGIWQALDFLNTLVDDSDPDINLPQIEHLVQTAEAIRSDGHPGWFVLTGLVHDLGKVLCLYGEPQWAVVGDTFPVGCSFSETIVCHEYFRDNPDSLAPEYQTKYGIYEPGCGLDNVHMSWGHDEYLYRVMREYLPEEALYMIRYHSFYPAHRHGAYDYLMNDNDRAMFEWVRKFNPYDLYTKSPDRPDMDLLMPYYEDLVNEFFPAAIAW